MDRDHTDYTFRRVRCVTEEVTVSVPLRRGDDVAAEMALESDDWEAVSETGCQDIECVGAQRVIV